MWKRGVIHKLELHKMNIIAINAARAEQKRGHSQYVYKIW